MTNLLINFNIKKLVFLCAVYAQSLCAIEPTYISLGSTCTPAFRLNELKLRLASYPFDWIISHFESLYGALDDDFGHFFKDLTIDYTGSGTLDHYSLIFHHVWHEHFPDVAQLTAVNWESKIPLIEDIQLRRIERFRRLCNSNETVVFVRYDHIDKESAQRLRNLIKSKYPNLTFILMVVKNSEDFQEPWNLPQIINFSIEEANLPKWQEAFKQVSYLLFSQVKQHNPSQQDIENLNDLLPDGIRKN